MAVAAVLPLMLDVTAGGDESAQVDGRRGRVAVDVDAARRV